MATMNVLSPSEQKCMINFSKEDCGDAPLCEWAAALNKCNPKCASLPENRCTAYPGCDWNSSNNKCQITQQDDEDALEQRCETKRKCAGTDAQGNTCVLENNKCVPSFIMTMNPDSQDAKQYAQNNLKTKHAIYGIIPLAIVVGLVLIYVLWKSGFFSAVGGTIGGFFLLAGEKLSKLKPERKVRIQAGGGDSEHSSSSDDTEAIEKYLKRIFMTNE
jgi:hypothetical protein